MRRSPSRKDEFGVHKPRQRGRANKDRRVYVIQLGTHDPHYLVLAPEEMAGEHHMIFIFDRTFKLTGGWTG